jgi:putative sterol carrier protein
LEEGLHGLVQAFVPEKAKDWNQVINYTITGTGGGEWHIIVKDQKCELKKGKHEKADLEFEVAADTFIAMGKGEITPIAAFMSGKMKAKGSTSDLMKMGEVFPFATPE